VDSNSVCRGWLGWTPATPRYKGRPCGIKTQDFADFCRGGLGSMLAEFYSIADYSTTTWWIPVRFMGGCWARRQLRNSIRDVPVASRLRISYTSLCEVSGSMRAELYSIADYSTTTWRIPILCSGGCWAWRQLYACIRPIPTRSITMKLPLSLQGLPGGILVSRGAMGKSCVRCRLYFVELEIQ